MRVMNKIDEIRCFSREAKASGKRVGFVPTMGFLHEGHLSLARQAKDRTDTVIMSIFVNPAQFGEGEDLETYPRDLERDVSLAEGEGVDAIFAPDVEEMYPPGSATFVEVRGPVTEGLCGRSRPGHFRGVTTIVAKLFNAAEPDEAFFGQKDAQQLAVIKRMVKDLDIPVDIIACPIVREEDGLAMSSRNTYLSPRERRQALALPESLEKAKELIASGETSPGAIKKEMEKILKSGPDMKVDYVEIVDADSLEPLGDVQKNTLIAVAAFAGRTRLIDNAII